MSSKKKSISTRPLHNLDGGPCVGSSVFIAVHQLCVEFFPFNIAR